MVTSTEEVPPPQHIPLQCMRSCTGIGWCTLPVVGCERPRVRAAWVLETSYTRATTAMIDKTGSMTGRVAVVQDRHDELALAGADRMAALLPEIIRRTVLQTLLAQGRCGRY
jgi:hypothetical protein